MMQFYLRAQRRDETTCCFARWFAGLAFVLFAIAPASGQGLIYVDADDDFNGGGANANIAPLSAFDVSGDVNRNDGLWHVRDSFGYDGPAFRFLWEATGNVDAGAGDTGEDVPEITQKITGLTPGSSYKAYAVFWSTAESWPIRTGVSSGNLTLYDGLGTKPGATAGIPTASAIWATPPTIAATPAFTEADRTAYLGFAGTVVANGSGEALVYIDDLPGDSSGTRTWFDGVAYLPAAFSPIIDATINRDTGVLTISNNTGQPISFTNISITSASQSLDAASWSSITNNYDTGAVDTDPWEITAPLDAPLPSFAGTLSEMESAGGSGGATLAHGSSINLGGVWNDSRFQDVQIQLTRPDTTTTSFAPMYTGTAHLLGDFNNNGSVGLDDYAIFSGNLHSDVSALGQAEAYLRGDMNGDLAINHSDFVAFRNAFPGSLEAALAQVPEPSALLLAVPALVFLCQLRSMRRQFVLQPNGLFRSAGTQLSSERVSVRTSSMIQRRLSFFFALVSAGSLLLVSPTQGANITLTASDALGETSFNSGLHWSNSSAPSAGNDYITGDFRLRTPPDANSYTFAGDSLKINNTTPYSDGLLYKGTSNTGIITIPNLILEGGLISHANGVGDFFQLDGAMTINNGATTTSTIYAKQGNIDILADISGAGNLSIPATDAPAEDNRYVTFLGNNTYTGNIDVAGRFRLGSTGTMTFDIGAAGVNNTVSGTGTAQFEGAFNLDLSGASSTLGDSWTLVSATNSAFGDTFSVDGFFEYSTGQWVNGMYQFDEATGILSVATPPDLLTLRVNTTTGLTTIVNDETSTTFDMNYYEIRSESGSLVPGSWTSIDGNVPAGTTTWEKAGGSSANLISETNLFGMESLAPAGSVSIGNAFSGTQDLEFYYGTVDGGETLYRGFIEYVSGGTPGDFDGDGDVDGRDFLVWQRGGSPTPNSATDLQTWRNNYGSGAAVASVGAVPEPSTLLGAMAIVLGTLVTRRR